MQDNSTIDMTRKLPRPDGHHSITPALITPHTARVLAFAEHAFGAKVLERYDAPDGRVGHAEMRIGDSIIMAGDPVHDPAMPAAVSVYVDTGEAVDTTYARAIAAGAKSIAEPSNKFYGYRSATVADVGGNRWTICAVVEQLTNEEIVRRMRGA